MLLTKTETNNCLSDIGKPTAMPPGVGDPTHAEKFNVRNLRGPVLAFQTEGTCVANSQGEQQG